MASEAEASQLSYLFERMIVTRECLCSFPSCFAFMSCQFQETTTIIKKESVTKIRQRFFYYKSLQESKQSKTL